MTKNLAPYIVFRDVDQSNVDIQEQMQEYVNNIVDMDTISNQPKHFWLRDFTEFLNSVDGDDDIMTLPFNNQLDIFLSDSTFNKLYQDDIARDIDGNITASRVKVQMNKIDQDNVVQQINALKLSLIHI